MLARVKSTLRNIGKTVPVLDRALKDIQRKRYLRTFFAQGPSKKGSGTTFLVLDHCYALDAEALCQADTAHTIWILNPFAVFTNAYDYFPPGQRDLECAYGKGPMEKTVEAYRRDFIVPLVERLIRETKLEVFWVPSDTFYWVRAMIEEFRKRSIPTVVQDKEGTLSEGTMLSDHSKVLAERYPPISDRYYFWNENQKRFWTKVGLASDMIEVSGQPRSDFFFHPERWPTKDSMGLDPEKKLIVAFTYDADAYSGEMHVGRGVPRYPWTRLRRELHEVLRKIARERSDVEIVIKAHPQQNDLAAIRREFEENPIPNVKLSTGAASASHLIVRSDVVIGFQTTALIEAMLTRKPVIYAGWGEAHEILDSELLPIHHSGGCLVPRNSSELDECIRSALEGRAAPDEEKMARRKQFCDRYFFNADGTASARILDAAAVFKARWKEKNPGEKRQ